MAHLSGDEGLLEAFRNEQDVHRATAAEVFGVELDAVSDAQRQARASGGALWGAPGRISGRGAGNQGVYIPGSC
jgi:hypothetical protein